MADEFFSHWHALLLPPPASELSEESLPTLLLIAKLMKVMGRASRGGSLYLSQASAWTGDLTPLPASLSLSSFLKFSLDTLYVSTAKHLFEKNLKPKLLKSAQARSSTLMSKEVDKLMQTLESYLLSIVNPEWAVAIAISLTQEVPEGLPALCSRDSGAR